MGGCEKVVRRQLALICHRLIRAIQPKAVRRKYRFTLTRRTEIFQISGYLSVFHTAIYTILVYKSQIKKSRPYRQLFFRSVFRYGSPAPVTGALENSVVPLLLQAENFRQIEMGLRAAKILVYKQGT